MGSETGIAWCDSTFNPWWGCTRIDELCRNCYAETWDRRFTPLGKRAHWGLASDRRLFGDKHWNEPLKWNREAEAAGVRRRVFCASMADVFEDRLDLDDQRQRLWKLIDDTPHIDWLLLTKRPENFGRMLPVEWLAEPQHNVWLGTSVGDKKSLVRLEHLRDVPAAIRFVSGEPLIEGLGRVDLRGIDWWVIGGESGPGARPMDLAWARMIGKQCADAGVPCFFKQAGSRPTENGVALDLRDSKGGDLSEIPADLRVRDFPEVSHG